MRRDREIRTRLYPSIGFVLLMPFAQLLSHAAFRFRAAAVLAVVMTGMMPSIVLEALRVSSHHPAADLFLTAPLASVAPLFQGVRKAVICYVVAPAAVVAVVWIAIVDMRLFALAVPSLMALPLLSLLPAAFRDYVPLSVPPAIGRQSTANIVIGMVNTIVCGTTVVTAWVAWRFHCLPHFVAAEAMLFLLGARWLSRRIGARPLHVVG
jgi:hypothetical protein